MKKLKKKYWVMLGVGVFLLLAIGMFWGAMNQPVAFEDLDPEDYSDSPELKELVVYLKNESSGDPIGNYFYRGCFKNLYSIKKNDLKSDPRYYELLMIGLNAKPQAKFPQFVIYLYNLCIRKNKYTWKELSNGTYYIDGNARFRMDACTTLGELGDKKVSELLIARLSDSSSNVQSAACCSLAEVGDVRAVGPLIKILEADVYDGVKSDACYALGKIGDKRAFEPLVKMLDDPSPHVSFNACDALGELGDKRAIPILKEKLQYLGISEHAQEALETLGVGEGKQKSE